MLPNVMKKLDGFYLIAHKLFSLHAHDHYLSIVLVKRDDGDYVVWTYNSESGGFSNGFYSSEPFSAIVEYNERGRI